VLEQSSLAQEFQHVDSQALYPLDLRSVKTVPFDCEGYAHASVHGACDSISQGPEQGSYLFELKSEYDLFVILETLSSPLALCNEPEMPVGDGTPYFALDFAHAGTKCMHVRH
jgi:hypothetical protein